jgi:hypothetical protein
LGDVRARVRLAHWTGHAQQQTDAIFLPMPAFRGQHAAGLVVFLGGAGQDRGLVRCRRGDVGQRLRALAVADTRPCRGLGRAGLVGRGRCGPARIVGLPGTVEDLKASTVGHGHGHIRSSHARRRLRLLGQGQSQESLDFLVALLTAFATDATDDPLDLLGRDVQLGQTVQGAAGAAEGSAGHDASVGDLGQDRTTGFAAIKAEAGRLREKKPSDSSCRSSKVPASRQRRHPCGQPVAREDGAGWGADSWDSRQSPVRPKRKPGTGGREPAEGFPQTGSRRRTRPFSQGKRGWCPWRDQPLRRGGLSNISRRP